MPHAQPLKPTDPSRLGDYELTGRLGEGGQGVVYLGLAPSGDQVAVKLLHAALIGEETARRRFLREVDVAKRVARFCTAQVLHADIDRDRPYIVSEYIDGQSLHRRVALSGPLSGGSLERLAIGTATALTAIHQAGIVHRDFKPQNVLLGPDGPRVIDFGIARALSATSSTTAQVLGTPSFMAPEQTTGAAAGPPADVFAWGVTVAYAANGWPPFGQDSIHAVLNRVLHDEPALGELSGALRELVAACLAKDPQARPGARQVLLCLLGQDEIVAPPPAPRATPPGRPDAAARAHPANPAGAAGRADVARGLDTSAVLSKASHLAAADTPPETTLPPAGGWRRARPVLIAAAGAVLAAGALVAYLVLPGVRSFDGLTVSGPTSAAHPRSAVPPAPQGSTPSATPSPGGGDTGGRASATVPRVAGLTRAAAAERLRDAGLTPGRVRREDSGQPLGRVLRASHRAGVSVPAGTRVDLWVSYGTAVPPLVGLTTDAAGARLGQSGLEPGGVTERCSSQPSGEVLATSPAAGTRVNVGSHVALTVSEKGRFAPSVVGQTRAAAESAARERGFSPVAITRVIGDQSQHGRVLSQDPPPTACAPGDSAPALTLVIGEAAGTSEPPGTATGVP
ncbi:protein kinase domain-containing protein [Bailinhaonella thermotolerans]|uniref:non-specific serine/threonine protein kinase n=1 Tax=Bailinhaonella thermotolerans TaxID=1070861 RepID=A0A3A4A0X2_9ACTN|nr:PASTA domain-containing protein [Bailinhaonella thermotolerans]RJL21694.1 PASTA domain-containing protein [Bailinhaonella thermotolerans]